MSHLFLGKSENKKIKTRKAGREKHRAIEQPVSKHVETSLTPAHKKTMNTLPPPEKRDSSHGDGEVDVIQDNQQRLLVVDENMLRQDRHREYNTQSQKHPSLQNFGSKVPLPAHSSVVGVKPPQSAHTLAGYINLPVEERNFNLFRYPAYQFPLGFIPYDPNKIQDNTKISHSVQPFSLEMSLCNTTTLENDGETGEIQNLIPLDLSLPKSHERHVSETASLPLHSIFKNFKPLDLSLPKSHERHVSETASLPLHSIFKNFKPLNLSLPKSHERHVSETASLPLPLETQHLQLGALTARNKEEDRPLSLKRKVDDIETLSLQNKKLTIEEAVLSHKSETNPLLTSTAKIITTVMNTADTKSRPKSDRTPETPKTPVSNNAKTLVEPKSYIDGEKSNNHDPPPCHSLFAVHKLKKALLQKYYREGLKNGIDVVAPSSCITPPHILPTNSVKKQHLSTVSVSSEHNRVPMTVNSKDGRKIKGNKKSYENPPEQHDTDNSLSFVLDRKILKRYVKRKEGGRSIAREQIKRKKLVASNSKSTEENNSEKQSAVVGGGGKAKTPHPAPPENKRGKSENKKIKTRKAGREKHRAIEQPVSKHVETSLTPAHKKTMNTLPPPEKRYSSHGDGEDDVIQDNQQRLLVVDENMLRQNRDREYNTQSKKHPSLQNFGSKVPLPAHSSVVGVKPPQSAHTLAGYINLPVEERNFNLFRYPAYQFPLGFIPYDPNKIQDNTKISHSVQPFSLEMSLCNTTTLENDGETGEILNLIPLDLSLPKSHERHVSETASLPLHSIIKNFKPLDLSLPKSHERHVSETASLPPAPINNNLQLETSILEYQSCSPLPHLQCEAQNLHSVGKMQSVPSLRHLATQSLLSLHRQSLHQPSLLQRQSPYYLYSQSVLTYYQRCASQNVSTEYSKITQIISHTYTTSVIPPRPAICYTATVNTTTVQPTQPINQEKLTYGKQTSGITAGTPVCPEQELRAISLPVTSKAPMNPSLPLSIPTLDFHPDPNNTVRQALDTQHLQLGALTARNKEEDRPLSLKRKVDDIETLSLQNKKLAIEEAVLSDESETNPLLTSTAKIITTVMNTADTKSRPKSDSTPETPKTPVSNNAKTLVEPKSYIDGEKSNKHDPPPYHSLFAVHKLKKALLQKYYREGLKNGIDVVAPSSCITPPHTLPTNSVKKQHLSTVSVSSEHNRVPMTVNSKDGRKIKGNKKSYENPPEQHDTDYSLSFVLDRKILKRYVKRKEGGRSIAREQIKRKKLVASNSKSTEENNSEKQSAVVGGGGKAKTTHPAPPGNKRGDQPCRKELRDKPSTSTLQRDRFTKPSRWQLKTYGESFLQDGLCFEVAPKLAKCIECKWTTDQQTCDMPNNFCRFFEFRRLRYERYGQLDFAGFSDPYRDPSKDDIQLWLPMPDNPPADLDFGTALFILMEVGKKFCDLLEEEYKTISIHTSDDKRNKAIAWKRVVQGVREMCDVCATTLFNCQWVCCKCGFVVCIDCYKERKHDAKSDTGRDRDDLPWILCTNEQPHKKKRLMLAQSIPANSLLRLDHIVRETIVTCNTLMHSDDPLASQAKRTSDTLKESGSDSNSDEDRDSSYQTQKKHLLRQCYKSDRSCVSSHVKISGESNTGGVRAAAEGTSTKESHLDTADELISSDIENTAQQKIQEVLGNTFQLMHLFRPYNWEEKVKEHLLHTGTMILPKSKIFYPDVPYLWLCDGKVIQLMDPNNPGNYQIFHNQWETGQPVIVSDVTKHLNVDLWHPDSFARDFGETKNDLINFVTGNIIFNQSLREFWEGFEYLSKRLKDEAGFHMLLKLKDWPPSEDFAKILPSRFDDLMKALPLGEYTQRSGRLNLVSRLPPTFLRPDLGPKIYAAYGSTIYDAKGTMNLHLESSDTVNVMVYVGIPKDSEENIKEVLHAIDKAGCDNLTRSRVCEEGEVPGALWHIYTAKDAEKIRTFLNEVTLESGVPLKPHQDPIHDQTWYLDGALRERLREEYGVESYAIVQCLGDAVFIPAGAPYQVRNLHDCIQVAQDFVSSENISHCFKLTQEIRNLSNTHSNHEDKLQIKNILYHAVKDALSTLNFTGIHETRNQESMTDS